MLSRFYEATHGKGLLQLAEQLSGRTESPLKSLSIELGTPPTSSAYDDEFVTLVGKNCLLESLKW